MREPRKAASTPFAIQARELFMRWLSAPDAQSADEYVTVSGRGWRRGLVLRSMQLGFASTISCTSLWLSVRFGEEVGSGLPLSVSSQCSKCVDWRHARWDSCDHHFGDWGGPLPPATGGFGDWQWPPCVCAVCIHLVGPTHCAAGRCAPEQPRSHPKCTLLSVGDGVIATDQRNHIQVINPWLKL